MYVDVYTVADLISIVSIIKQIFFFNLETSYAFYV